MNKKRILKIVGGILAGIVLVVVVGVIVLVTCVNPNNYKPLIIGAVKDSTHRELSLNGNISWKVWPALGLHLESVALSNPNGFSVPNLVEISSIDVAIELLPLLERDIVIEGLTIDGLNLALLTNGSLNNWTFDSDPQAKESAASTDKAEGFELALKSLALKNSNITYNDLSTKDHYGLKDFDFKISANSGGEISIDQEKQEINLDKVNFDFSNILRGNINFVANDFSKPTYSGDIDVKSFSMKSLLVKLSMAPFMDNKLGEDIAFKAQFSGDSKSVNINKFNFSLTNLFKGNGSVKLSNFSDLNYVGNINLPNFSLNQLLVNAGIAKPKIPNQNLLNKVSLVADFSGGMNDVNVSKFNAKISDSNVSGNINVLSIEPLRLTENVKMDKLELSDIADTNGFKIPLRGISASGNLDHSSMTLEPMSHLNAKQNISVNDIVVRGFNLKKLIAQVNSTTNRAANVISITNLQQLSGSLQVVQSINNLKATLNQAKNPNKDLNQQSDLGQLNAVATIKNGIINPLTFTLDGPDMKSNGSGSVNLVDNTLNYTTHTQVISADKDALASHIIFTYSMSGKMSNMQGALDWVSIQKQFVDYLWSSSHKTSNVGHEVGQKMESIKNGAVRLFDKVFK